MSIVYDLRVQLLFSPLIYSIYLFRGSSPTHSVFNIPLTCIPLEANTISSALCSDDRAFLIQKWERNVDGVCARAGLSEGQYMNYSSLLGQQLKHVLVKIYI